MDPHSRYLTMAEAMQQRIPGLRPPSGPPPFWTYAATFGGAAGLTAAIMLIWHSMRATLAVGGSCAEGGPYVVGQSCPEGSVAALTLAFPLGILALAVLVLGAARLCRGGAWIATLAWPALFLLLGGTFLAHGLTPSATGSAPTAGWLLCAGLFTVMGGLPLLGLPAVLRSIGDGRLRLASLTSLGVAAGIATASALG